MSSWQEDSELSSISFFQWDKQDGSKEEGEPWWEWEMCCPCYEDDKWSMVMINYGLALIFCWLPSLGSDGVFTESKVNPSALEMELRATFSDWPEFSCLDAQIRWRTPGSISMDKTAQVWKPNWSPNTDKLFSIRRIKWEQMRISDLLSALIFCIINRNYKDMQYYIIRSDV